MVYSKSTRRADVPWHIEGVTKLFRSMVTTFCLSVHIYCDVNAKLPHTQIVLIFLFSYLA